MPRQAGKQQAAEEPGSASRPTGEERVQLPPGFGFAADAEPKEESALEDLEEELETAPEEGEEGGEEGPLSPREEALLRQVTELERKLGEQGTELGDLRRRAAEGIPSPAQPAISPVQDSMIPDPFEAAYQAALDEFVQTADTRKFAVQMNRIQRAQLTAAGQYFGQYFRDQIREETKAESDFFAKHEDLSDGTPRAIFEGELAKVRLANPRAPASQQRESAADATRELLQELHWRVVEEDADADRQSRGLRGAAPRRTRTGAPTPGASGMQALQEATARYRETHRARQARSRSRG